MRLTAICRPLSFFHVEAHGMKNPSLAYPIQIMIDEARSIELRLSGITDPTFKRDSEERMHGCRLAQQILNLYAAHQMEPLQTHEVSALSQ